MTSLDCSAAVEQGARVGGVDVPVGGPARHAGEGIDHGLVPRLEGPVRVVPPREVDAAVLAGDDPDPVGRIVRRLDRVHERVVDLNAQDLTARLGDGHRVHRAAHLDHPAVELRGPRRERGDPGPGAQRAPVLARALGAEAGRERGPLPGGEQPFERGGRAAEQRLPVQAGGGHQLASRCVGGRHLRGGESADRYGGRRHDACRARRPSPLAGVPRNRSAVAPANRSPGAMVPRIDPRAVSGTGALPSRRRCARSAATRGRPRRAGASPPAGRRPAWPRRHLRRRTARVA